MRQEETLPTLEPDRRLQKNRGFRLGFALAGVATVTRREKSFRTQLGLAVAALAALGLLRPGFVWAALVLLSIGLVLALEAANAAIEYLADALHPGLAEGIGRAKDAAAGAVLLASLSAAAVGALMVASNVLARLGS